MVELLGARVLEAVHLAALGIDARHDVTDGAVLARGVHGLEDQEQRVAIVRVENVLEPAHPLDMLRERCLLLLS